METKEYLKWIIPSQKNRSVIVEVEKFNFRVEKAKEQMVLPTCSVDMIIEYVNEFFSLLKMKKITIDPKVEPKKSELRRINYSSINTKSKEDIVWIKFSKNDSMNHDYISVIGTGCDIYFTELAKSNTTAGRINKILDLEWNEDMVLIFPLEDLPVELYRSDIESGIGNYLISKGVPILDYYSHNF